MTTILADRLELWGFQGDFTIFSDGSLGFGLEATPVDISCWDEDRINGLSDRISQFLNGLPDGVDIQFVQEISGGNKAIVDAHLKAAEASTNEAAKSLTEARVKRLLEYDTKGLIPKHGLKIFVRRSLSIALVDRPKLFSRSKKFEPIAESRFEVELGKLEHLKEDIIQGLQSLDLSVSSLKAEEILNLMYWQWNPSRKIDRGDYDPEDIRSSIVFTDVVIYERGFSISDMHHRVLSLKTLPDQTYASMASILRSLPFDSKLFVSVHVPNQIKELDSLQTQRRIAFSMARGKKSGVSDIESEAKLQDLESLLEQMIAQGEKVFHVSVSVLLRSKNKDDLETQVSQTLSVFRELSGAEGMEESLAAFDIFSEFSLPNARSQERSKRVKTSNLCDLLPLYGPWRGFERPSVLLRTRMGSLFSFDPFSSELTNANQLISGGSGSGKSFMANILLLQTLKENPKVFFVDIGGSYKKLCENLSGQYLPLGIDSGISMNPFDLAPNEKSPSSEKIKFLVGLVELITKEDTTKRLPKLERAELEEAIGQVYDNKKTPKLSDLRDLLLENPEISVKRLGRILTQWCGDTPFGRFLDRETNVELNRPIVAFDLKGVESFPDLQAACLFCITEFVWREVQRDQHTMKFLVFDECWKLLKDEAALGFIEGVFRTFRKYYASAIAISQDISDFADSKIAGAILPNCSIKWILIQNQSDPRRIQEILQLNAAEMGIISSLSQKKGVYSEAFLIAQKNRMPLVIESTPLEYWISTTDPRDLSIIETYSKENFKENPNNNPKNNIDKTHIETLRHLSEKYPQGIAAFERGRGVSA